MVTAMVPTWTDAFCTKVGRLVSTPRGKGKRDEKPAEEFFIGDEASSGRGLEARLRSDAPASADGPGFPPKEKPADDGNDQYQEARTLAVEYDEQGKRFK